MRGIQTTEIWRSFSESREKELGKEKAGVERTAVDLRSNENFT